MLKLKLNDIQGNFGCITKYENIAIGSSSYYVSYLYPTFKNGDSIYLDDYSFEELSQYSKIYLSGFKYKNKEQVENLLLDLKNGITIELTFDNDLEAYRGYAKEINIKLGIWTIKTLYQIFNKEYGEMEFIL